MNYSFMSFSCPKADLRTALRLAEQYGYQGFEPRIDSQHAHGIEPSMDAAAKAEVRAILADTPVELCCLASSIQIASRSKLSRTMDEARRVISLCSELDIPRIRIFGGPIDEEDTRSAAIDRMARSLDALSQEIGDADITLCLETHDSWTEPAHAAAVMARCQGRHAAINWDVMHTRLASYRSESEAAALLAPYIRHVHIHGGTYRPSLRFLPVDGSVIDHAAVLRELQKINYRGYLSGEWIGWDQPDYLKTEIQTMKKLEATILCTQ